MSIYKFLPMRRRYGRNVQMLMLSEAPTINGEVPIWDGSEWLPQLPAGNPPNASAYVFWNSINETAQTVGAGQTVPLNFDPGGPTLINGFTFIAASPSQLIPNATGIYNVKGTVAIENVAGSATIGPVNLRLVVNNSLVPNLLATASFNTDADSQTPDIKTIHFDYTLPVSATSPIAVELQNTTNGTIVKPGGIGQFAVTRIA